MPTVSIIIPTYKAETYIEQTLTSVLNQDFTDWEAWVIDDGSPDQSGVIAQAMAAKDNRIKYFRQKNAGVSAARNQGFALSQAPYLAFLDADDVWLFDNLSSKLARFEAQPELGLVHSDAQVIDEKGQTTGEIKQGIEGCILDDLLLWEQTCIPAPSSILVKRQALEEVGGFNTSLSNAADFEFFYRIAHRYPIGRIARSTWQYRVHGQNMHQNMQVMEADELRSYALARKNGLFRSAWFRKRCYANMYLILAASWWGNQNKKRSLYWLFRALLLYPPVFLKLMDKIVRKLFRK